MASAFQEIIKEKKSLKGLTGTAAHKMNDFTKTMQLTGFKRMMNDFAKLS